MKAIVLLSKTFPKGHPKAGQKTRFRDKILMSIGDIEFACECGWTGLEEELSFRSIDNGYDSAGMPVYVNDSRCPACDGYAKDGLWKIHTCRSNYEYWKNKIDRLKAEGGVLSVRQWSEKPFRSPQEIITDIPAENVGIQKMKIILCNDKSLLTSVDGKSLLTEYIARNDGLLHDDFKAWFFPAFKKKKTDVLDLAIIYFTKFRY